MQAVLVRSAGLPDQAMWHATLGTLADATIGVWKLSPCVVIVGQVAAAKLTHGEDAPAAAELTPSADAPAAAEPRGMMRSPRIHGDILTE